MIVDFAQIADQKITEKTGKDIISSIIDNLWEIYYGAFLKCDFVIAGKKDSSDIWSLHTMPEATQTGDRKYTPPIILQVPQICGVNGNEVSPSNERDNNLISIFDNKYQDVFNKLNSSCEEFRKRFVNHFLLPHLEYRVNGRACSLYGDMWRC